MKLYLSFGDIINLLLHINIYIECQNPTKKNLLHISVNGINDCNGKANKKKMKNMHASINTCFVGVLLNFHSVLISKLLLEGFKDF